MLLELNQVATYWNKTGDTDRYGKPVLSAPVWILVRWEDRQTQILNKAGVEVISKSRVYCQAVLSLDGYLALGTYSDADPRPLDNAYEIQPVSTTPDLSSLESLTTVYL